MTCFTGLPVGVEDSKREAGVIVIDQYFNAPFIPKSCVQGHKNWNEEWTRRAFPLVLRW